MKCQKCGFDNPEGTLFCEECDWRLDQIYRPEKKRNPLMFAAISCVIGIVAIALAFVSGAEAGAIAAGAIGMVISGYSVNLPRYVEGSNRGMCMALSGVGIALSVIGFLVGLTSVVGA